LAEQSAPKHSSKVALFFLSSCLVVMCSCRPASLVVPENVCVGGGAVAAVKAHVREGAGVATRMTGLFGGAAAGVAFSVAAWPVAHLHALNALEALSVSLGLRQGGLGVRRSLRDFLGGTHLSERSTQAPACESDALLQNRSFAGVARLLSRLLSATAAVSWDAGSHGGTTPRWQSSRHAPEDKVEGKDATEPLKRLRGYASVLPRLCTHGVRTRVRSSGPRRHS